VIITKTPYRVSLFGGGSDHPAWYSEYEEGKVLSFAIDKYSYLNARLLPPFFNHSIRLAYSKIELVNSVDEILHPAFRETMRKYWNGQNGLEVHHHGDLPAQSGVGSSSSFVVGLINALQAMNGVLMSPQSLAESAIEMEQRILKENVGSQDQVAAAFGGFNRISFSSDNVFSLKSYSSATDAILEIESRCILIFSGVSRFSSNISAGLISGLSYSTKYMKRNIEMVAEAERIIQSNGDLDEIGLMLNENWNLKKALNRDASNTLLDEIYTESLAAGALGGKLLGAGGGGFFLFWLKDGISKNDFVAKLRNIVGVPFKIDTTGSQIVYNSYES
jgi:D-glycero-alpha-D-manno-heptose-7-phosphate kinase